MTHELTISFDDQLLARKYCISCSCGWRGSAATYAEAEGLAAGHERRMGAEQEREGYK